MSQQEMSVPQPPLLAIICGNVRKTKDWKGVRETSRCSNVVYLHDGVDPRFKEGECGKCGTHKAVRK